MSFGLGKGFDNLIPTDLVDDEFDPTAPEDAAESELLELPLQKITPDTEQPRKSFREEELKELADSIREHGVLQPIVVSREEDEYKIIAGERRYRAAKLAGLTKIPAIVRTMDAQNRLEMSIIENAQRADLNPIELATAYAKLKSQFNLSNSEVAKRVGKSQAAVVNTLRLLKLPDDVKKAMLEYDLKEGPVRPLVNAEPELVREVLPKIIEEDWSARQVERYMTEHKKKSSVKAVKTDNYIREEEKLSEKYAARVRVHGRSITITCKTDDELRTLLGRL